MRGLGHSSALIYSDESLGASKAQSEHLLDFADANYSNSLLFCAVSSNSSFLKKFTLTQSSSVIF